MAMQEGITVMIRIEYFFQLLRSSKNEVVEFFSRGAVSDAT